MNINNSKSTQIDANRKIKVDSQTRNDPSMAQNSRNDLRDSEWKLEMEQLNRDVIGMKRLKRMKGLQRRGLKSRAQKLNAERKQIETQRERLDVERKQIEKWRSDARVKMKELMVKEKSISDKEEKFHRQRIILQKIDDERHKQLNEWKQEIELEFQKLNATKKERENAKQRPARGEGDAAHYLEELQRLATKDNLDDQQESS